jgi:hypothetical protein
MKDKKLDRLLQAAARVGEETPAMMPFGFDTRVVALWSRNRGNSRPNGITSLVRRVALLSAAVIVVSTVAVVLEANQSREINESFTNEFAIADSAIQDEFAK